MATENSPNGNIQNAPVATPTQSSDNPLPLPEPRKDTDAKTLDVGSGQGVKLDHIGPMVVNRDGTLSRISNWEQMTEIERQNTLRILGKRNQLRLDALRDDDASSKNSNSQ